MIMKRLILALSVILLPCLTAPGGPYPPIPLPGGGSYNLLGSQFAVGETLNSYSSFIAGFPIGHDGDEVLFWDVAAQDLITDVITYDEGAGVWRINGSSPSNPALPLGQAFFYINNDNEDTTITRNIWI